jgi:hypothetical protein
MRLRVLVWESIACLVAIHCDGGTGDLRPGVSPQPGDASVADAATPQDAPMEGAPGSDSSPSPPVPDASHTLDAGYGFDGSYLADAGYQPTGPTPPLTPGVWRNISPPGVPLDAAAQTYGTTFIEIDPQNLATLYLSIDQQGLWKSTDAGSTWTLLGAPPATFGPSTKYLDSPGEIRVDPKNSTHLYATQGVRGTSLGFWVSTDGGQTWSWPPGFTAIVPMATNDMALLAIDPTDFNHVLISSHSPWQSGTAGILETKDGGMTFVLHPPASNWGTGTLGINFLFSPERGIGDSQTWLVSVDGDGTWRTKDGGMTWAQVSTYGAVHGGNHLLYFTTNAIYAGGNNQILRSTDQGESWSYVGPRFQDGYYQVIGDGNVLYAQESNTGANSVGPQPYVTSPESDGVQWTPYQGGAQLFSDGPYTMRFDPVNRIVYSANWRAGLWALKVL